jgi:WD40 repeat protein
MDQHVAEKGGRSPEAENIGVENEFAPPSIPDHELLRCIGRGSYGTVWLARNRMGMHRAIKIVYRRSFQSQRPFEREWSGIQKFEPISRSHEGFVDVLHVGMNEAEGYFYYVMELGDDQISEQTIHSDRYTPRTLAKEISRHGRLPLQSCLQLGIALSQALAELHKRGLVHRDVKPSNIIFVNGIPKLADIGLVAEVNQARSYVGTEGFIPPEGPGRAPADVYGLGKVLYEASTGKDRQDFPELPTHLDELPDHTAFLELNEVILRACKNEVKARYQSAWDMHADLLVVANGKSVKRLRSLERGLANLKRAIGVTAVILALGSILAYHFFQEHKRELDKRQQAVGAAEAFGIRALDSADYAGALIYFARAIERGREIADRETLNRLRFGSTALQCPRVVQMWFASNHISAADVSRNGRQFVIADSDSGHAQVYELDRKEARLPPFKQSGVLRGAEFSPDGERVVTAGENTLACVWRVRDGFREATLPHPTRLWNARFSPDGSEIVTAGVDHIARVWNWRTQTQRLTLRFHTNSIMFASFNPDGKWIVTAAKDNLAQLWDAATGERIGPPLLHGNWVRYAAFSPDGRTLVTVAQDNKAYVWDLTSPKARHVHPDLVHGDKLSNVAFSPDGRLLVTACLDGTASVWLLDSHQLLKPVGTLRHRGRVTHAVFTPDGHRVLTCCNDGTIRLWELANESLPPATSNLYSQDGRLMLSFASNAWAMRDAASGKMVSPPIHLSGAWTYTNLNRNGHFVTGIFILRTNSQGATVRLRTWDTRESQFVGPALTVSNLTLNAEVTDDGNGLVTFHGPQARLWDLRKATSNWDSVLHPHPILGGKISPDGQRLALWGENVVTLWDMKTGKPLLAPLPHEFPISWADFNPDGLKLVVCENGKMFSPGRASLWNVISGRRVFQMPHGDGVLFGAFSPDGSWLATAGEDSKAILWNTKTGQRLAVLSHRDQVQSVVFSPDNRCVVTASWDGTAQVWSVDSGHPLTPPLRHLRALNSARFLGAGQSILTVDVRGTARVWELPLDRRPLADLFRLTQVLSGEAETASGRDTESLSVIWEDLRSRYAADFSVTPRQIELWHEFQGLQSYQDQQWAAAKFHLGKVLEMRPADPFIELRLNRIEEHLRVGN